MNYFFGIISFFSLVINVPIHPLLLNTKQTDLVPCDQVFNVQELIKEDIDCINKYKMFPSMLLPSPAPQCFIVKETSPDVENNVKWNFNSFTLGVFNQAHILGFFEDKINTIYIADNRKDILREILLHELGHSILSVYTGNGDGAHIHPFYSMCSFPTYDPRRFN